MLLDFYYTILPRLHQRKFRGLGLCHFHKFSKPYHYIHDFKQKAHKIVYPTIPNSFGNLTSNKGVNN